MGEATHQDIGEVLIVTGMSGAGRSTAANALEDLDWYVVDNLPPQMLKPLLDLTELAGGVLPRVAVVVDVRGIPRVVVREGEAMRCLLYTSPSPRDGLLSRMPSSA